MISFIGMETREVAIHSGVVKVVLQPDVKQLDEVVVTAYGLTRKEKSLGYSTQVVKAEELQTVRQTDLNNALVGKVSGVRFWGGSGAKFDAGRVVLRGTTSLDPAGSEPLYVVDGVITGAGAVNMDDVESVNVLKGPAATALYGSRGGNGAIIITTKGVAKGHREINVSHTTAVETPYIHYDMQDKYGGGYYGAEGEFDVFHYDPAKHPEYLQQMDGMKYYDFADDASWGPEFKGQTYAPWYAWDPTHPKFGQTEEWKARMDLRDLFQTGMINTTNVSFANSSKNYMSRISFSNTDRKGVNPNSDALRRFLSIKTMFKPVDRLTLSMDYKLTHRKNHNGAADGYGGLQNVLYSYQQWGHTNVDLSALKDYRRPDGTFRSWNMQNVVNLDPAFHNNPFALYNEINQYGTTQWNMFNADAILELPYNLKVGVNVNGNLVHGFSESQVPFNILDALPSYSTAQSNRMDVKMQGRVLWNDKFINDRLAVDAALFVENRDLRQNNVNAFTRDGLIQDGFFSTNASAGLAGGGNAKTEMKEQSIFGTGTVGFDDTYYIDFSLRNDWTSTLHPDNNSYLYGGFSAAVLASNLVKASWLNFWKVRASMAQVGSTMGAYQIFPVYVMDGKYGAISKMRAHPNLKDPMIKPTISTSYEIGTEFRVLGDQLWGDFNFYNRDSKNQIININTTPSSGYSSSKMNAGMIRNRGIELSLGGRPVNTRDWTLELNANISRNKNTLEELAGDRDDYFLSYMGVFSKVWSWAEVGKPIGVIRGSAWKRDPEGNMLLQKLREGHPLGEYVPIPDMSAQKEFGNIQPDATGGITTMLRYKNLRFNMVFDFQIGGCVVSFTNCFGEGSGLLKSTTGLNPKGNPIRNKVANGGGVFLEGSVKKGEGVYEPASGYCDANHYYQMRKCTIWEDYVYDASYLKMRELSLTYDMPFAFLKRMAVQKASISFVAQNPWLIYSAVPNIDPSEIGGSFANFVEGGQPVSTRSFGLTLSLTF